MRRLARYQEANCNVVPRFQSEGSVRKPNIPGPAWRSVAWEPFPIPPSIDENGVSIQVTPVVNAAKTSGVEDESSHVVPNFSDDRRFATMPTIAPLSLIKKVRKFSDPLPLDIKTCVIAAPFKKGALNRITLFPFIVYPSVHGGNEASNLTALVLFEPNVACAGRLTDVPDLTVPSRVQTVDFGHRCTLQRKPSTEAYYLPGSKRNRRMQEVCGTFGHCTATQNPNLDRMIQAPRTTCAQPQEHQHSAAKRDAGPTAPGRRFNRHLREGSSPHGGDAKRLGTQSKARP